MDNMSHLRVHENKEQVDDTFNMDLPDIPEPTEAVSTEINDEHPVGFKFGFIGSGQGGSRIAETFYKLGYRRVCVVNTAEQDLATIDVPNKLKLGTAQGAGKDRSVAKQVTIQHKEDIEDLFRRSFGKDIDRIFVTVGAGGGTGAGSAAELVKFAAEYQETVKAQSKQVGVIVALPKISEGKKPNANAYETLKELTALVESGVVSPLIVLDNEKINTIYPKLSVNQFWGTSNSSICTLFNLFNNIVTKNSNFTTFDAKDYKTILDSGIIVFGATQIKSWSDGTQISKALRENLNRNILSGGLDISTGTAASAIIIGDENTLNDIPQEYLDNAFDQLNRMLKTNSTVHQGIYKGTKPGISIFTAIGGIATPTAKLEELKKLGGV